MNLRTVLPGGAITLLLATGFMVVGIGVLRGSSTVSSYFELQKSREILEQTVQSLQAENANLANEFERIRTSPSYAKKVLRDKYHLTEENEDIVFFAD